MVGPSARWRFGVFELDVRAGELRKHGIRLKVQRKPISMLSLLVERAGEMVTRDELRKALWPGDDFGDFDHGLGIALNKLRAALGDSAERPRFIETLPGRGYRLLVPVRAEPTTTRRLVAVLPFENLTHDPDQEYFADGFTEELTTQLSQSDPRELGVIARTSAARFKGTQTDLRQIGRELGVQLLVQGSIRRFNRRIRITAQLTELENLTHTWANSYEADLWDVLEVQRKLATQVANSLQVELIPKGHPASPPKTEAYDLYLQGRHFWRRRTEEGCYKAIELFQESIRRDPSFSLPHTGVADAYIVLALYGIAHPPEAYEKARSALNRALHLNKSLPEAHSSLGFILLELDWNWLAAESEHRQAIELNPNYASGHHWYGLNLMQVGQFQKARSEFDAALTLDPLSVAIHSHVGRLSYLERDYDRAVVEFKRALELDPEYPQAHYYLAMTHVQRKSFTEALAEMNSALEPTPGNLALLAGRAFVCRAGGKDANCKEIVQFQNAYRERRASHFLASFGFIGSGRATEALECLERAFAERSGWLLYLAHDPAFDPLRSNPMFCDLVSRVALEQSRAATASA